MEAIVSGATGRTTITWTEDGLERDGEPLAARVLAPGLVTQVLVNGQLFDVDLRDPRRILVNGAEQTFQIQQLIGIPGAEDALKGAFGPQHPPMNGTLVDVAVAAGQTVAAGDILYTLEAMKMQVHVKALAEAKVVSVGAQAGSAVAPADVIVTLEAI